MDDINSVVIVGRLTKDGELKYTNSNNPMAILNSAVAVNRSRKNGKNWENEVSYFEVTVFGKRAESLKQYMRKGKQIAVVGTLRQERWTDKETQKQRSRLYIAAENIQLIGSKDNGSDNNGGYQQNDYYGEYGDAIF